ncbi:MAG: glycosyltransferase, partial [Terrimicrobiaceae bacterium]
IAAHDVYMLASTHETGPLTLLEGMKGGLVPICGNIPCLVDEVIRDGQNGFLVPQDDPKAYVDAILRLHQDRPLLERLSAAAREIAATHYSEEAMADRYLGFIAKHIDLKKSRTADWPEAIDGGSRLLQGPRHARPLRFLRRIVKKARAKDA